MRALVFVVLAAIAVSVYAGKCGLLGLTSSKAVDDHTTTCPQYAGDSCCSATFTEQSCSSYDGCRHYPDTCSFLQGLLACGTACKPDFYSNFLDGTKIRLCDKYYDAMEKACLEVKVCDRNGNSSIDCRQNSNSGSCQSLYDNANDFWTRTIPTGVTRATDNCFSAGFAVLPSSIMVVAALILAFFH